MLDSRLWEVAKVVFAAASTQVSVERDISHFAAVFAPHRHSISARNLENVMQVKLNEDLLPMAIDKKSDDES